MGTCAQVIRLALLKKCIVVVAILRITWLGVTSATRAELIFLIEVLHRVGRKGGLGLSSESGI
jgi:hypothetical protein